MGKSRNFSWPHGLPELHPVRSERRDAAEHRRRILEAAQHLFAEQGVDAVSMHQIAVTAGVGQGTLYRRYAHKGELCMDLLHERHEQLVGEMATLFEASPTAPALERLDGVMKHLIAFLEEQGAMLEPIAKERKWMCNEPEQHIPAEGAQFYTWLHELFVGLLTEAVSRGELAAMDIHYTAAAILSTFHPLVYRFQRQERGFSPERILEGMHHIYIDGLKTPQARVDKVESNLSNV